jgi:hypothetical protein
MLVCNVSLRPPRLAIAADLAEAVTAVDATATGNVVFATLVDDPGSAREVVDAYLGEIMVEAASAADVIDVGLVYVATIDEGITAADLSSVYAPGVIVATVVETATASDTQDAATPLTTALVAGPFAIVLVTPPAASVSVLASGTLLTAK